MRVLGNRARALARSAWYGFVTTGSIGKKQSELDVWVRFRPSDHTGGAAATSVGRGEPETDELLFSRIALGYRKVYEHFGKEQRVWGAWLGNVKRPEHTVLLNGSSAEVTKLLQTPHTSTLHYGFDEICRQRPGLRHGVSHIISQPSWLYDLLLRVAEGVGVERIAYPELLPGVPVRTPEVEELLKKLDKAFGFTVSFPNPFPGETGLATSRGIATFRAIQSLFQAWRIHQQLAGRQSRHVVEIGGGLGRTAYYALQFGCASYTIIDIPLTSAAQANFLGRVLGPESISIFGEKHDAIIRLVPPAAFLGSSPAIDLMVNFDGITEQPHQSALAYWTYAADRKIDFLSVNHEVNHFTFRELFLSRSGGGQITRTPFWLRRGYVDEMVTFSKREDTV